MNNKKSELAYWLALYYMPKIGSRTIMKLRNLFPCWDELFSAKKLGLHKLNLSQDLYNGLINPPWDLVEQTLKWLEQDTKHHILTSEDLHYPKLLREISTPPTILFVKGDIETLGLPQLAMVGSRNPSLLGLETAHAFAMDLAAMGFVITSGLAAGIDGACHRGALAVKGKTVAVMGTGIDQIYPAKHQALAEEILESSGALVSEFPLGAPANAKNFPQRNRIISGLSIGTLVLEATCHSGSLITARCAAEAGREVFAIPGSIHNPLARGCHAILRQGAKLVETANDILEELKPLLLTFKVDISSRASTSFGGGRELTPEEEVRIGERRRPGGECKEEIDSSHQKLLECVDLETTAVDVLIARSGLSASVVTTMLTNLELQNAIKKVSGGYVKTQQ